jgi:DNA topoisomerase I
VVRACQDLPGQELFQYVDAEGQVRDVTSLDVNAYLREICGEDITAKDFRTWHGTVMAAIALDELRSIDPEAPTKRNIRAAIERVASRLGNTPTICRKCYVHPEIVNTYVEGSLLLEVKQKAEAELRDNLSGLTPEETAVLTLLQRRLSKSLKDKLRDSIAVDSTTQAGLAAAFQFLYKPRNYTGGVDRPPPRGLAAPSKRRQRSALVDTSN